MSQRGPAPFTAFLDRDGVLIPNPPFGRRSTRRVHLFPGAGAAVARLNAAGIRTCLVTNQPWVGVLTATPGMIRRVHGELARQLAEQGARLDRIEVAYAPPFLDALPRRFDGRFRALRRRKPLPGMLEDADASWTAAGEPFDRARAAMVGDTMRDAGVAHAYGIPCVLLATTHTEAQLRAQLAKAGLPAYPVRPSLEAAVPDLLGMAAGAAAPR